MDCSCNCFGCAASSKKPVKRYNLLVPDIFPKKPPPFTEQVDAATERKLKKLYEYLEKNLHRGPKVSRRLARRINKELAGQRWGFVQIAVAAYIYLLEHLRDADSALFAKEVVCQLVARPVHFYQKILPANKCVAGRAESFSAPESEAGEARAPTNTSSSNYSVVGALLHHQAVEIRTMGTELLASFTRQQVTAEYLAHTEAFVGLLCRSALEKTGAEKPAQTKLQISCLVALQEQVDFCLRASASPKTLEQIVSCLLEILAAQRDTNQGSAKSTSPEAKAAQEVLLAIGKLAQVPAEGKRFVLTILQFVDQHHLWDSGGAPSTSAAILLLKQICRDEQQQYLIFSRLAAHVSLPGLAPLQQLSTVETARQAGEELPASLATAALVLAVKEWAPILAELEDQTHPDVVKLRGGMLGSVASLAAKLQDAQHLLEALGGLAAKAAGPTAAISTAALLCTHAAAGALCKLKAGRGVAAMPQLLFQELSVVMLLWQPQQQVLAHRVLAEVIARATLREPQEVALLSVIWHQVTQRSTPGVFVAVSGTLTALAGSMPPQRLAVLTDALEREGTAPNSLPDVNDSQRLGLLQLCRWAWASPLEAYVPENSPLLSESAVPSETASHLRIRSKLLEQTDSAPFFTDEASESAELEQLRVRHKSEARLAEVQRVLRAAAQHGSGAAVGGKPPLKTHWTFAPLPISALQPKVAGSWWGGSRTVSATADQESGHRATKLRAAVRSRTTEQLETAPAGIRTMREFLQASLAESQSLGAAEIVVQENERAAKTMEALTVIDRLLET